MSLLTRLCIVSVYCFVCHAASGVLFKFIFPWLQTEEKGSLSCMKKCTIDFIDLGNESCLTLCESGIYDSPLRYQRFVVVNFIVVCLATLIYSLCASDFDDLMEYRIVNYFQFPLDYCRNIIKGNAYM
jgi:hypothetical protein